MGFIKDLISKPKMNYSTIYVKSIKDCIDIHFKGTHDDTTGLGGSWSSEGSLLKVYKVSKYLVISKPFSNKPIHVIQSVEELNNFIKEKYKVELEWNSQKSK
jgi:hypothetical protein